MKAQACIRACTCVRTLREMQAEIMKRGRNDSVLGGLGYLWDAEEEPDLLEQAIERIQKEKAK